MTSPESARKPAPGFAKHPGYRIDFLPCSKRVRALFNGTAVVDSTQVRLMRETGQQPVYYFPRGDVRMDLLEPSPHRSFCPFKGEAAYWTLGAGGRRAENAVWGYPDPFAESAELADYLAFYWDRMDQWVEEDEEVFVHARDPFTRLDVLDSHRPLRVVVGGKTVAQTTRARFLFETGLPPRHYIPEDDVRMDLLVPSETRTACPYKGTASYYSLRLDGKTHEDLAWTYREPLPETARLKGYLCFFSEKVDAILLDSEALPKRKAP